MTDRYYRICEIDHIFFDGWLHLPKGFKVDAVRDDPFAHSYLLRISCPERPRFHVGLGECVPRVSAVGHTDEHGFLTRLEWPELEEI